MTEIAQREMVEAIAMWSNFSNAQNRVEEANRRLDAGEEPEAVIAETVEAIDPKDMLEAIRRLQEFLGLSEKAMVAFQFGLSALGIAYNSAPALIGLVIGIRAQQIAQEAKEKEGEKD